MKKILSFVSARTTLIFTWIFAVMAPWLFYVCRLGHVYIDIVLFDGFCTTLFFLMAISAVCVTIFAFIRIRSNKYKDTNELPAWLNVCNAVFFVLTFLFTVVWIASLSVMGKESSPVAFRTMLPTLFIGFAIIVGAFFALFFPAIKPRKMRAGIAAVVIVALFFGIIGSLYPLSVYKIISHPMVIDTGKDYSVVFATNTSGTGYISYEYEGKSYLVYDETDGRKVNSRIHSVSVPYEHLDGNVYSVGSTRIIDELSYGGTNGRTVESKEYAFRSDKTTGAEKKYLCVSDWHTHNDLAKKTAFLHSGYDGIILLGDALPGLQFEEEAAEYIVSFGGELSGGTLPVYYVRGNHETRGSYATSLSERLGLDGFYYVTETDEYRFVILDSAEDKADDHPEYGGMTDYSAHRAEMVEWLEGLAPSEKPTVVFSHDPKICLEEDLQKRAFAKIESLNAVLMVSGHTHTSELRKEGELDVLIDGGHDKGKFVTTSLTFGADGIEVLSWDEEGKVTVSHTFLYAE